MALHYEVPFLHYLLIKTDGFFLLRLWGLFLQIPQRLFHPQRNLYEDYQRTICHILPELQDTQENR